MPVRLPAGLHPWIDGEPSALPVSEFLDLGRVNDLQFWPHLVEMDHGRGNGGRFNGPAVP